LHVEPEAIQEEEWNKIISDYSAKNKIEILADIGFGKRLSLMVAHQLIASAHNGSKEENRTKPLDKITIQGSEGMAVQFAQCCRPIPGDPILGFINKDKGLVIHTHDCPAVGKFKLDPDKWLDVEWDAEHKRLFKVNLSMVVANQRGMLAKIAAAISDADSNIDNVDVAEADGSQYTNVDFTVQVHNRLHLAKLIRGLRKIPDVARINRVKGTHQEQKIQ
jgi:GTP pyrophosphokinase